jgi:triosephosphate isomerase
MRKPFVAGNWKMNLDRRRSVELAERLGAEVGDVADVRLAVCPPFVYLPAVGEALAGTAVDLGAQDMYFEDEGAYTGEVAGAMLLDVGCRYVILGHSERRHVLGEDDALVSRKVRKAISAGLEPIVCVGETLAQRQAGETERVVSGQLRAALEGVSADRMATVTIAYEPVWAIGTGQTATPRQAQDVHRLLRGLLAELYGGEPAEQATIQYGGSVKPDNAAELMSMPDVDGALVGGASLKADAFAEIVRAARGVSK